MKTVWTTSGLIGALKTAGNGSAVEVVSPESATTETCGLADILVSVLDTKGSRRQKENIPGVSVGDLKEENGEKFVEKFGEQRDERSGWKKRVRVRVRVWVWVCAG